MAIIRKGDKVAEEALKKRAREQNRNKLLASDEKKRKAGLEFAGTEITNDSTNTNIYIRTNGTGKLQTNYAMQLDNNAVSPAQVSGSHVIYSKAESTGRTGIFFVNTENTRDELVSKNRALLFSMLF